MKQLAIIKAKMPAMVKGTHIWCNSSFGRSCSIPNKTVMATTNTLPKNSTKSPIVFIVNTRKAFEASLWNAFDPAAKNASP